MNIYQTIVIIWGASHWGSVDTLIGFTIVFGLVLFILSVLIGKYSLTRVDTALAFINPFTQDIIIYRARMATGLYYLASGNTKDAAEYFEKADQILDKWIK